MGDYATLVYNLDDITHLEASKYYIPYLKKDIVLKVTRVD